MTFGIFFLHLIITSIHLNSLFPYRGLLSLSYLECDNNWEVLAIAVRRIKIWERVIERQGRQKLKCSHNLHLILIRDRKLLRSWERFGLDEHLFISIMLTQSASPPFSPAKPDHLVTQLISPFDSFSSSSPHWRDRVRKVCWVGV